MTKRRRKALTGAGEGAIKDIYKLFIRPLLKVKPDIMGYKHWLDGLFHTDTRSIQRMIVKKSFRIKGRFHVAADITVPGLGCRIAKEGQLVWVRHDTTKKDLFELEIQNGPGRKWQWFDLTCDQWFNVTKYLDRYPLPSETEC